MNKVMVNNKNVKKLVKNMPFADILSSLLAERGIQTAEEAEKYMFASVDHLHSPGFIRNIDSAYDIIKGAVTSGKKIFIFGDYDADGITGTAIMYLTLKELGANVDWRLPDRLSEGYGMSAVAVEELHQRGAQVIITIDNGIRAVKEIALAKSYGMEVVIIDHHVAGDELPPADAILNLHVEGEAYPFIWLAGCGLAFKVSCYLYERFGLGDEGFKHLDLAAIGTVADVVPLVDENRIIVREGLKLINSPRYMRRGILNLLTLFMVERGCLDSMGIGFKIGPALNAPGRLKPRGAEQALRLLLATTDEEAINLSSELFEINEERKELTAMSLEVAEEYILQNKLTDKSVIVVFLPDVPEGLVGLVSGRITEKYNRPSLVFSEGRDYFKGSARSTEKFNLYRALCECDDLFVKYGGHAQAAGMSIVKNMDVLKKLDERLNEYAESISFGGDFTKDVSISAVLKSEDLTFSLIETLSKLEPYGQGNRKPIFLVKNYLTRKKKKHGRWQPYAYMGNKKQHLKIFGCDSEVVGFDMAEYFEEIGKPRTIDVLFSLSVNHYQGHKTIQLECLDITASKLPEKARATSLMEKMAQAASNI